MQTVRGPRVAPPRQLSPPRRLRPSRRFLRGLKLVLGNLHLVGRVFRGHKPLPREDGTTEKRL